MATDTDSYAFLFLIINANERMTAALKDSQMKKSFSHSLLTSFLLLSVVYFSGCGGDEPDKPDLKKPEPIESLPVPGLSFTSLTFSNEGDSFSCIIHGLTPNSWSVKSDEAWCNVSNNGNILKINVLPNTSAETRNAVVSIIHSDKREMGCIKIKQCSIDENEQLETSTYSKHSFFPMFTATWCPYSPDMDKTLEEIQKRWDFPILTMRIHVKDSELYTPLSKELSEIYNNSTTPKGYFENYFSVDNMGDANVAVDYFWNMILANTLDSQEYNKKCSAIGCKSSLSGDKINAEITIKPTEEGEYRLLVFILKDKIISAQMSKNEGEIQNYCHNSVLVGTLTSITGEEMVLSNSSKAISLNGYLPSDVDSSNLRLLIVLEHNVASLNYSNDCWYADNCMSVSLGNTIGNGMIENINIGENIGI